MLSDAICLREPLRGTLPSLITHTKKHPIVSCRISRIVHQVQALWPVRLFVLTCTLCMTLFAFDETVSPSLSISIFLLLPCLPSNSQREGCCLPATPAWTKFTVETVIDSAALPLSGGVSSPGPDRLVTVIDDSPAASDQFAQRWVPALGAVQ